MEINKVNRITKVLVKHCYENANNNNRERQNKKFKSEQNKNDILLSKVITKLKQIQEERLEIAKRNTIEINNSAIAKAILEYYKKKLNKCYYYIKRQRTVRTFGKRFVSFYIYRRCYIKAWCIYN